MPNSFDAPDPQPTEQEGVTVEVASESDEAVDATVPGSVTGTPGAEDPRTAEGSAAAPGGSEPHAASGGSDIPGSSSVPPSPGGGAVWIAPESSSAGARRPLKCSRP